MDALAALASDADQIVVQLPVTSIRPNRYQPRRSFNAKALQGLADSIAAHGGVLQPILVRPAAESRLTAVRRALSWSRANGAGAPPSSLE
jgi:ParB family chromosome partitioning protein